MKPLQETIQSRIKRLMASDPTTLKDQATVAAKGWWMPGRRKGRKKL